VQLGYIHIKSHTILRASSEVPLQTAGQRPVSVATSLRLRKNYLISDYGQLRIPLRRNGRRWQLAAGPDLPLGGGEKEDRRSAEGRPGPPNER